MFSASSRRGSKDRWQLRLPLLTQKSSGGMKQHTHTHIPTTGQTHTTSCQGYTPTTQHESAAQPQQQSLRWLHFSGAAPCVSAKSLSIRRNLDLDPQSPDRHFKSGVNLAVMEANAVRQLPAALELVFSIAHLNCCLLAAIHFPLSPLTARPLLMHAGSQQCTQLDLLWPLDRKSVV